jgi:hypothetical protein
MLDISRRRFLLLCGAGVPGLWLAGRGLIHMSSAMVAHLTGVCSFCNKSHHEVQALAGVLGRPARICDQCIGLCVDIIAEELGVPRWREPTPRRRRGPAVYDGALVVELRARLAGLPPPPGSGRVTDFSCTFCDAQRLEVQRLISGPKVFVCDRCALEGAGLIAAASRA